MLLRSFVPLDVKSEAQQCSLSQLSVCWHHHQYYTQWYSQGWLCLNTHVCLNLTLRYMKILEVAAAMCKGHLGEKYWEKANSEWGIPVKSRAESELRSSLAIQPLIFNPPWKEEEFFCCLVLLYISFAWSLTLVNDSTHHSDGVRNSN